MYHKGEILMKRVVLNSVILCVAIFTMTCFSSCRAEKNITVIVREQGSGTREAFDKAVTDGIHYLEEKDSEGRKLYNTTVNAVQQTKGGVVLSSVFSDKNAIGYVSLAVVGDFVKTVSIDGVFPSEQSVFAGDYKIQRPFVIMTSSDTALTERANDFLNYLKSVHSEQHVKNAGCIFLSDPYMRANVGMSPIEIVDYQKKNSLPAGDKIVIRGSTSVEKLIMSAAKAYAEMYCVNAEDVFDIQLEGSSVGKKCVSEDTVGNVIGLSSAYVYEEGIDSFNICLDAVAVIVNKENTQINNLTLTQLYEIFSGKITKFSEIEV